MARKRIYKEEPSTNNELLADKIKNANPKLDSCVHFTLKGNQLLEIGENPDMFKNFIEAQEIEVSTTKEELSRKSLKDKVLWFTEKYSSASIHRNHHSEIILSLCRDILNDSSLEESSKASFIQLVRSKFPYIWILALCESSPLSSEKIFSELIAAINVVDKVQAQILQIVGKDDLKEIPKNYKSFVSFKSSISLDESVWSADVSFEAKLSFINLLLDEQSDQISVEAVRKHKSILEEYMQILKGVKSIVPLTDLNHSVLCKRDSPTSHPYIIDSCSNL